MKAVLVALAGLVLAPQDPAPPERPGSAPAEEPVDTTGDEPQERALGDIPIEELSGEERAAAEAALHERLEEEYFRTIDLDGGGWISFREGEEELRMDRDEFFRFDADADGRITREEFGARYRRTVEASGSFRPPASSRTPALPPGDSPLLYDANRSGALEEAEVRALVSDRGIDVPANALFGLLDQDRSGALETQELAGVVAVLSPLGLSGLPGTGGEVAAAPAAPRTVRDLFGAREPREGTFGPLPLADRIAGPVPPFERLDYDGDGLVEEQDLLDLLRPARVEVRASTVIAALDLDGDGRLSRAEVAAAFGDRP